VVAFDSVDSAKRALMNLFPLTRFAFQEQALWQEKYRSYLCNAGLT